MYLVLASPASLTLPYRPNHPYTPEEAQTTDKRQPFESGESLLLLLHLSLPQPALNRPSFAHFQNTFILTYIHIHTHTYRCAPYSLLDIQSACSNSLPISLSAYRRINRHPSQELRLHPPQTSRVSPSKAHCCKQSTRHKRYCVALTLQYPEKIYCDNHESHTPQTPTAFIATGHYSLELDCRVHSPDDNGQ